MTMSCVKSGKWLSFFSYRDIYNDKFQWRALRILGKRTHIHFSNEAEKLDTKDIGTFLENYVMSLAERNPILQAVKLAQMAANPTPVFTAGLLPTDDVTNGTNGDAHDADHQLLSDNLDDLMDMPDENGTAGVTADDLMDGQTAAGAAAGPATLFSKEQIRNIASLIAGEWERFAEILKFGPDSTDYWKQANPDPVEQAVQMLQVWMEMLSDQDLDSNDELGKFLSALKDNYNFEC